MYRRILTPLDGSTTAEQVLPYVSWLAKNLPAPVELLRVVEYLPPEWMDWLVGVQPLEIAANMTNQAEEYLAGIAQSLSHDVPSVVTTVRGGPDAATIVEEAEQEPDTLLAMSTHGRTGITRWVLGSVADKVLHATAGPLFLVRARDEDKAEALERVPNLQTIIVPLDGSTVAEQVIPHVVALAQRLDLGVVLVRATLPVEEYYRASREPVAPYGDPTREIDTLAQNYFGRVQEELRQQGVSRVAVKTLPGHAADAIIDLARETPHSLVAMTTHGRSGVGRWALGSVTDRVTRHCEGPMLIVRAVG
jgi:nucleotide-binding universal stress UspA family protein